MLYRKVIALRFEVKQGVHLHLNELKQELTYTLTEVKQGVTQNTEGWGFYSIVYISGLSKAPVLPGLGILCGDHYCCSGG